MWGHAVAALLLVTLVKSDVDRDRAPPIGGGVNIFSRYGYLSISLRVVPRNDSDPTWIFREPSVDIFRNVTVLTPATIPTSSSVFQGDFHMEFCDNQKQLLQAYFRDFTIERLDRPWRAFTASWSRNVIGKLLGLSQNFVSGQHSYVLVRVSRHRDSARINPLVQPVLLTETVEREAESIVPGDVTSVTNFIRNFGSHYVAAYVTGNSLYQVFVYTPQIYAKIKERLKSKGIADLSNVELSSFFSPWYAEHIGSIQVGSGNSTVEAWAAENLRVNFYFFSYSSLLKLHGNASLLKKLNALLDNEALLQLNLKTLTPALPDEEKRRWFQEVLDNYLKLWEVNM